MRPGAGEVRKKFLLQQRVTENWNKIPSHVKNVKTVSGFKRSYKKTQRAGWPSLEGKRFGGKMEGWTITRGKHSRIQEQVN
jgi:hypothetical protein